jgi:hypothetical protein
VDAFAHLKALRIPGSHVQLRSSPVISTVPLLVLCLINDTVSMGKTRGHGSRRGAYRGGGRGGGKGRGDDEESEEEEYEPQRGLGANAF